MTYTYATIKGSSIYHIVEVGQTYALCGVSVKTGKYISSEPPAGKKECPKCGRILRNQPYNAGPSNP
jgi:hypothetical protein